MTTIYFMYDGHNAYWGTYSRSSANGLSYEMIMRRDRMRQHHHYGKNGYYVSFSRFVGQFGERQIIATFTEVTKDGRSRQWYEVLTKPVLYMYTRGNICLAGHDIYVRDQISCFKNRTLEYPYSYLIPMSKNVRLLNERWKSELV